MQNEDCVNHLVFISMLFWQGGKNSPKEEAV